MIRLPNDLIAYRNQQIMKRVFPFVLLEFLVI